MKAHAQPCARFGGDHQPAFLLALLPDAGSHGLRVGGVDLDRELVAGEDIFGEQRGQFGRRLEPDLADPRVGGRGERRGPGGVQVVEPHGLEVVPGAERVEDGVRVLLPLGRLVDQHRRTTIIAAGVAVWCGERSTR